MGSGTNYRAGDARHWEVTRTVGGHKVLRHIKGSLVNNLPTYSETSDFYLKENASGEITQMRVYGEKNKRGVREPVMDVDIRYGEEHTNNDGTFAPEGVLHIHDWKKDAHGKFQRSKDARPPTQAERDSMRAIWETANPNVRILMEFPKREKPKRKRRRRRKT